MNKKLMISLLACTMAIPTSSLYLAHAQENARKEEYFNLALRQPATASNSETVNGPENAVDGDLNTRWATNEGIGQGANITIDFKDHQKNVKQVDIFFERGIQSNPQNIKGIKVEALDKEGNVLTTEEVKGEMKQHTTIVFKNEVKAEKIRVTTTEVDTNSYVNVGIREIEVYSEEVTTTDLNDNYSLNEEVKVKATSKENDRLTAEKVKDGDTKTRWASKENSYENESIEMEFPKLTKIQEVLVKFHLRDVDPKDSNVKEFDLIYTDQNNQEQKVLVKNIPEKTGYKKDVVYQFETPVYAKKIKLDQFDVKKNQYNNISIQEIEVYSHKKSKVVQGDSLDSVVANVQGRTVNVDETNFKLPDVPTGYTIEFNGADFQQIIGKANADGTIPVYHPLVDKKVKVSFNVKETKTGKVKNTGDKEFTVKGTNTQEANKNKKPVVIPEIQEWYSNSTEKLSIQNLKTVVYSDPTLKPVVEEFIKDYQNFTGITLTTSLGQAQNGSISFVIDQAQVNLGNEGYAMDISNNGIVVKSSSVTGNMYGMQTILQMYKEDPTGFAIGSMHDYPRFETRGLLLDVARKPVSLEMMKEITRTMRYYKMNDFQAHLSDNYIFLENYGKDDKENEAFKAYEAFRLESGLKNDKGESPTAKDYFITKEEFYQFIQDERALGMKVVPEIDVPAHATSFTKIWPELMVKGQVSPLNKNRPLVDHFDLTNPKAIEKIKAIFDDYTKGDQPTFDKQTTIHIGADEFLYNFKSYRDFVNDIVPYIKNTNTVRMWGGLTWIKDKPNVTEIKKEAIENVEMNLWSSDWADGKEMYDLGFKLINTIDNFGYMVPNGSYGRADAYGDLLNVNRVFNEFEANKVRVKGGNYVSLPSGDDQVLGAAYAIWSDNIDKHASGLSESDLYWRFFDALPFYAEKTWAETGKEKNSPKELMDLANKKGTGPNTNPYYQAKKEGSDYAKYNFDSGLNDSSANKRDLTKGENANIKNGALQLGDKVSYVTSPLEQLGNGNALSFDLKLSHPSKPGDILFEEDAPYGTHDIRVMDNGKLGFTRELYDYYFDYELPVGKQVNIQIVSIQQKTKLYVDGHYISDATGRFFHENMVKKEGINHATFALPLERIGSKTNALAAQIDNVVITTAPEEKPAENIYHKEHWTAETNSQTVHDANEGEIKKAFDNNPNTRWHSNWKDKKDTVQKLDGTKGSLDEIYTEINFGKEYSINQFSFTPRTDTNSGYVTRASLYVKNKAKSGWKLVAEDQEFKNNSAKKTFYFDEQNVSAVKFVATQSSDGWVAVSEFDIANTPALNNVIYVEATKGGRVEGGKEALTGEKVTIKAIADPGYYFDGWHHVTGKVSDQADYTFKVNGNIALTAKFVKNQVDKSELQKLVDQAVTDFTPYTEGSVKQYQKALAFAKEVLENKDALQNDVNLAVKQLKEAVLVRKDGSHDSGQTIEPEDGVHNPNTGDQTNTMIWITLMGVSLAAFVMNKKRKQVK